MDILNSILLVTFLNQIQCKMYEDDVEVEKGLTPSGRRQHVPGIGPPTKRIKMTYAVPVRVTYREECDEIVNSCPEAFSVYRTITVSRIEAGPSDRLQYPALYGKYVSSDTVQFADKLVKRLKTAQVCGRGTWFHYITYDNYCVIDWLNCRLRMEIWQFAYFGPCVLNAWEFQTKEPVHDLFLATADGWMDMVYAED